MKTADDGFSWKPLARRGFSSMAALWAYVQTLLDAAAVGQRMVD